MQAVQPMQNVSEAGHAVFCRAVTKDFGAGESRTKVLRGVDFKVNFGGITMLVGESGCGKTTLLSIIAGLLNATTGEVNILGQNIAELSSKKQILLRRQNLGFVFQQFNLLPALTAAENVAVPLFAAGLEHKKSLRKAEELLTELGLGERVKSRPNQLSGGQQQRVALARALIHEPRLIVCDEPTSALDAATGRAVMELLQSAAVRPDRAVVVVTHDHRIFEFADEIAHMNDGVIVGIEKPNVTEH